MKQRGEEAIMYVAHPTRLRAKGEELCQFVRQKGYAPVNPFKCGEYDDFEGGLISREATLEFGLKIQRACGITGVFGISEGVLREIQDRLWWDSQKNFRFFYGFDPEWDSEYEKLKDKFGDVLAQFRSRHQLIIFVGANGVGKTYLIEQLLKKFPNLFRRVRTATTRPPRSEEDKKSYRFLARSQFVEDIETRQFLEHDEYLGNYYGSSLKEIREVLKTHHGVLAMTPAGARAIYEYRFELNPLFVLCQPISDDVLVKNLCRRGETDNQAIKAMLVKSKEFYLPEDIPHVVSFMTGKETDVSDFITNVLSKNGFFGEGIKEVLTNR